MTVTIKDKIRADLADAMKSGDVTTKETLRMILAAVIHEQTTGKQSHELTDEQFLALLAREAKKRREAATIFADNGRQDLADKELAEAAVIDKYLPVQLSDAELSDYIDQAIAALVIEGKPTKKDLGALIKHVKANTHGRVDGARLSSAISARIS